MNGRIYDPNLGRFLSVDPVFEFPTNPQSLNPYSYVLNNPLSMTDPTGYVAACGTGKANCPDSESGSVTVKTTAHELGSHIATHGMTTFTGTMDKAGNMQVTASGNGFGLGQTAEVSMDSHGGGNGAQNSSQGPGTGQTLGNSSNQGANTAPASSGNVAQANAATGSQTQTAREKKTAVDTTPSKLVIEGDKTENEGSYSNYFYQLENVKGEALTGKGYSLEEHLWSDRAHQHHMSIDINSENEFITSPNGEFRDAVGYDPPTIHDTSYSVYQTFTIRYAGKYYNLKTEFEHITIVVDKNRYVNRDIDITPREPKE